MEEQMCIDCLKHRIQSDISDKLFFSYAFSDSALPLASRAVVQMSNSSGEVSSKFMLVYLPRQEDDCITKYVDDCILDDGECIENGNNDQSNDIEVSGNNSFSLSSPMWKMSTPLLRTGMKTGVCSLYCENSSCHYSSRFSCLRTITAIAPCAFVGHCTFSTFENIASNFSSGWLEDDMLCSVSVMIEGKATCRASQNFLRLLGIPSFSDYQVPGCLRHPNLVPVLGMLKAPGYTIGVYPKAPHTLENILHYSPEALNSEWHTRFMIYQLLSALCYIHGLGLTHGNIRPSTVMFSSFSWTWLSICDIPHVKYVLGEDDEESLASPLIGKSCSTPDCLSKSLYADLNLSSSVDWPTEFYKWWRGELSNFEYLLVLNKLAGRRWGDHTFHTVMPWVIDFSVKPDENYAVGWRDLSKSKWRLAKGDEQLDFTYSTSEIPHHVSDECLSELAVCSYKARRLPLSVLRLAVRAVYEPNEYPSTMQRLYQWTPDECIPEFYCDHQIFYSLHPGMSDLSVPSWAGSPQEFIKFHRDALESERVSREIHNWIDITFGYKMSGQPAVAAKNVMLPSSQPTTPRPIGRRQLFTQPHPVRWGNTKRNRVSANVGGAVSIHHENLVDSKKPLFDGTDYLRKIEEAAAFCQHSRHLHPIYSEKVVKSFSADLESSNQDSKCHVSDDVTKATDNKFSFCMLPKVDSNNILEYLEEDDSSRGYQELLLWAQQSFCQNKLSTSVAKDIFSLGCVVAEVYLRKPLFDSVSLSTYVDSGALPGILRELPPHVKIFVEACVQKNWRRRPSAKSLLESPFFPVTVKSSYIFIAPLQLLAKDGSRLHYAANFAKKGALRSMGTFAAEICATYCLPLMQNSLSDVEAEWACVLFKEFLRCLKPEAIKRLVLPSIQKILQATGYSHLKVSLLQDSFVREVWNHVGKQIYLETIHPLIISNLLNSPHKNSASAASVLLIGSSEELGVPISIQQTILPLMSCFGKGLCADGINALVRIGAVLGESFIVSQILPLLKNFVRSCVDTSFINKPEPVQSWNSLALVDCLFVLDGLIALLQKEVVVKELLEGQSCLFVVILMRGNLELPVLQAAAATLITICQQIGPDLTALHIIPQLKELFDELAFSRESSSSPLSLGKSYKISKHSSDKEAEIESRMDLALLLYPFLATLLGIERLRQCCATWLLLEKYLLKHYNWKWEFTGDSSRSSSGNCDSRKALIKESVKSKYNPTKLLMNGVGWAVPQSQGSKGSNDMVLHKRFYETHQNSAEINSETFKVGKCEPWFWFPTPATTWEGPDFLARVGTSKDESPWKIKASVIHSVRAHHGALRSLAVDQDECTVFTAGVGPGFKGMVQRWDLSTVDCVSGYYGHEEVVNDICILPYSGRVASCDGTIHVWNSQTGKAITLISESSATMTQTSGPPSSAMRVNTDQASMLNSYPHSGGIFTSIDSTLYTCMHFLESVEKLVVGTGNGSLRFIDPAVGEKLHMWNSEYADYGFPSLVSAICSCGSDKMEYTSSHSWIAVGLGSGNCRLLDARSGNVIASWRAHDGYVTKLAAPEDHYLVSSSLDKTLRIWDLRKSLPPQSIVYKGHSDSILDFSVWGQDIVSIAKNKIGLSSLAGTMDEYGQHRIVRQALHTADRGFQNMSVLSSIAILPFSRLFLVGTEDGQLKICS
ncbi:protein GFS12-like isoform X2 [Chenopodium quinoa]|uniref:protein GFS12-like isoform X2 n=1 Tax=Chenopodium quinoa TaxID=63459 RepID=UPI000B774E8F|nr:protein GFS12-like isoform X2 [Chenopodium quinoa]